MKIKYDCGKKFAEVHGFDFEYVDEKFIKECGVCYKDLVGLSNVIILKKS